MPSVAARWQRRAADGPRRLAQGPPRGRAAPGPGQPRRAGGRCAGPSWGALGCRAALVVATGKNEVGDAALTALSLLPVRRTAVISFAYGTWRDICVSKAGSGSGDGFYV